MIYLYVLLITNICFTQPLSEECFNDKQVDISNLKSITKTIVPELYGKGKGEAGKIGIVGGSTEYTGAPYFAAISALKVGADLVYVITTESAAPIIKSYSPDLIVYPFLNTYSASKLNFLLSKMDVIVIGPGLGRGEDIIRLTHEIIQTCQALKKPIIIDADGLYAVWKNVSLIKNYPSPGVILTPNQNEANRLIQSIPSKNGVWYEFWGENVSVLAKGQEDRYLATHPQFKWSSSEGGSGRRAGGQGDILAGSLSTFLNWALKENLCSNLDSSQFARSVAAFAAARLTRTCNSKAFEVYGRSMLASDMLQEIHKAFKDEFE